MGRDPVTLAQHVAAEARLPAAPGVELFTLLAHLAGAGKTLARGIGRAALAGRLGSVGDSNATGDVQKKLDVLANDVLLEAAVRSGVVAAVASEELDEVRAMRGAGDAPYILCVDPLDGSSNTDINGSLGTIFGIYRRTGAGGDPAAEALRRGAEQIAAGYLLYGPSTILVYAGAHGVHGFTLDLDAGEFVLTHERMRCPARGRTYSANLARYGDWDPGIRRFIDHLNRRQGSRPAHSLRYTGALIADLHRTLLEGGCYFYPADSDNTAGKLRLVYECAPLAFVVEQAGGRAGTGRERVLDLRPEALHQRVPLVIGSREDVTLYERFLAGGNPPEEARP